MVAAPQSSAQVTDWPFTIERTFPAPAKLVFQAWTEPARLTQWWGPKGMQVQVKKLELKPGGTFLYSMATPTGQEMYGKFVYREITPPTKLAFVVSFCDANGTPTRHPLSPTWPLEVLSEALFVEKDGKTTLQMRGKPINCTPAEYATFAGAKDGMTAGWTGTMDQLAEHLAAALKK